MIRRPPRSTLDRSSAASDVYKRQNQCRTVIVAAITRNVDPARLEGRAHGEHAVLDRVYDAGGELVLVLALRSFVLHFRDDVDAPVPAFGDVAAEEQLGLDLVRPLLEVQPLEVERGIARDLAPVREGPAHLDLLAIEQLVAVARLVCPGVQIELKPVRQADFELCQHARFVLTVVEGRTVPELDFRLALRDDVHAGRRHEARRGPARLRIGTAQLVLAEPRRGYPDLLDGRHL